MNWTESSRGWGGLGALHLLATNMNQVEMRQSTGVMHSWTVAQDHPLLVIGLGAYDGLTFTIREYPIEAWRAERMARTGEQLVVLVP